MRETLSRLPERHFRVVYMDPPWDFKLYSAKGDGKSASRHYTTMKLADLYALREDLLRACHPDCHLFLWTSAPQLKKAIMLLEKLGFEFSSMGFEWLKLNKHATDTMFLEHCDAFLATGHTTRKNMEYVLLGRRGRPGRKSKAIRSFYAGPIREHSRKPAEIRRRIMRYADGPYLEVFARCAPAGWSAIGNEVDMFEDE